MNMEEREEGEGGEEREKGEGGEDMEEGKERRNVRGEAFMEGRKGGESGARRK